MKNAKGKKVVVNSSFVFTAGFTPRELKSIQSRSNGELGMIIKNGGSEVELHPPRSKTPLSLGLDLGEDFKVPIKIARGVQLNGECHRIFRR